MKKLIAIVLVAVSLAGLSACGARRAQQYRNEQIAQSKKNLEMIHENQAMSKNVSDLIDAYNKGR